MLTKASAAVIGGLKNVLTIIVLFILTIALVKWAQSHPDEWQALLDRAMTVLIGLVAWLLDLIAGLID